MIGRTRVSTILLVIVGTAVVGWALARTLEGRGAFLPVVPWLVDAAILTLAGLVLWAGFAVRAYQQGRRPGLSGIRAARTLVLAKAGALTGALLTGWYAAQVLVVAGDLGIEARRDKAIAAAVAGVAAITLTVAGLVAERWCQLPPQDGAERDAGQAEAPDEGMPA